jgi:DNA invertase Pin-like site-specific DNA recombinase
LYCITVITNKGDVVKAIIYSRVSSGEQGASGLGLEAQVAKCGEYASRQGLEVIDTLTEVKSGKSVKARPVLVEALSRLKSGEAQVLIVAKLDRLSRSLFDFATLLQRAEREGWSVVLLDLGVDTTTPVGRLQAQIVASVAEFERARISERCRDASKAKRARGQRVGGVAQTSRKVAVRVAQLRSSGFTLAAIADDLNTRGVPTARQGSKWYPATVKALLVSEQGRDAYDKALAAVARLERQVA